MVTEQTLVRSLAPEDIKVGTYVMTLHRQCQVMMGKESSLGEPEAVVIQVVLRPYFPELPAKVVDICLPFIIVERENRKTDIIDTRAERLAKVPKRFAKEARKSHLPKKDKKKKKSKSKKGKKKK